MAVHELSVADGWVNAGAAGTVQLKFGIGEVLGSVSAPIEEGIELGVKEVYTPEYEGGEVLWIRALLEDTGAVFITN